MRTARTELFVTECFFFGKTKLTKNTKMVIYILTFLPVVIESLI